MIAFLGLLAAGACSASAETQAGYNQADVRFNQQMITHHRQTIQLAELAAERGGGDYVRKLAKEIIPNEQADIQKMSGWLTSWSLHCSHDGSPPTSTSTSAPAPAPRVGREKPPRDDPRGGFPQNRVSSGSERRSRRPSPGSSRTSRP